MRYKIEYLGNKDFLGEGKNLLEVLCQVRELGVGRVVTKGEWGRRFPTQPSFVRVTEVEPAMDRWQWHGKVWGEWTFRGRPLGLFLFTKDLDRPDWHLIHRRHEASFMDLSGAEPYVPKPLPATLPLPPLLRRLEEARTRRLAPSLPAPPRLRPRAPASRSPPQSRR